MKSLFGHYILKKAFNEIKSKFSSSGPVLAYINHDLLFLIEN
jgi:hypothetical protein